MHKTREALEIRIVRGKKKKRLEQNSRISDNRAMSHNLKNVFTDPNLPQFKNNHFRRAKPRFC